MDKNGQKMISDQLQILNMKLVYWGQLQSTGSVNGERMSDALEKEEKSAAT